MNSSVSEPKGAPKNWTGFLFSQKIVPVILLILLVLVWSSVWSLFRVAMEVIPPLSFRVIIGLPAFILLLFLGFKKMKTVHIPSNEWKPLLLISFFNVTLWQVLMLYGIGKYGSDSYEIFFKDNYNVQPTDGELNRYLNEEVFNVVETA